MTDPDYKIEECFEPRNMKIYFLVYSLKPTPNLISPQFDTLEEAKECVRLCRKHSKRIFHYVEDCKMKSFNINSTVKVKLTEYGKQMLERDHIEFWSSHGAREMPYEPYETDADGYAKFQLWSLMEKLGKYCILGCEPPFDTVILIDENDLGGVE